MGRGERLAAWGVAVALLGLVYTGFRDTGQEIGALRAEVGQEIGALRAEVRADLRRLDDRLRRLDDRLRGVEVEFGRVDQRLLTLERAILPGQPD